jgi:recombinational DNA repair ATPase RecF
LSEYNHFLIQKQKLLKNYDSLYKNFSDRDILFEQINKKLSELSFLISFTRKNICDKFNELAPITDFSLIPQIEIEENFSQEKNSLFSFFQNKIQEEINCKRCLIGPHLAKINIKEIKNQRPISFLSSGEQRILLNNLILSQIQIYISHFDLHPIILFDDILTFFDKKNQELLVKMIIDLDVQFFIATNFLSDEIKNLDCQFIYL